MKHAHLLIRGAVIVAAAFAALPGMAQSAGAARSARDISGLWELSFDGRKIPPARLTAKVTPAEVARRKRGDAYAIRWCNLIGVPQVMDAPRPLNIQVGTEDVVMFANVQASPRHAYLDRSEHIDSNILEPSTTGDSIAHWEGDTLVVDTIGFSGSQGITSIPGGGYKTETSHLVERFQLLPGGNVLSVTSTWTDPAVYRVPHTYEYRYNRLPATYEAPPQAPCDPWSDERAAFLGWTPGPDSRPVSVTPAAKVAAPAAKPATAGK